MGTRSTYRLIETNEGKKKPFLLVYVQYDGYPGGHPKEIAQWLASGKVVNGIGLDEKQLVFNGAGCLAAQLIAKMKKGPGGVYIHHVNDRWNSGEDYTYDIEIVDGERIIFRCFDDNVKKPIFEGSPEEFEDWVANRG